MQGREMRSAGAGAASAALVLTLATGAGLFAAGAEAVSPEEIRTRANSVFGTLPEEATSDENPIAPEKVELGRMLYYEERISLSKSISCNTCHPLSEYGVDGTPVSTGHEGQKGERNSPTVYNAALHVDQFWDGRADDVEEQAKGPVLNPIEMGMPKPEVAVERLRAIPGYRERFAEAFPEAEEPVTFDHMAEAIGAFERKLLTPGDFDRFLEGEDGALSAEELQGLQTFMDANCIMCHQGSTVGGTLYQKMGLAKPYDGEDLGRYQVTEEESDRYVFKVPSLRNVAETAPYFSQGEVETLPEAVRLMGHHQLGRELSEEQVGEIVAFLNALTGPLPEDFIRRPELPGSGASPDRR